jgi:drug/metabolite transporter (DMT)-like permease
VPIRRSPHAATRLRGPVDQAAHDVRRAAALPSQPLTGRGVALMLGSVVCFALMAVTIRLASEQLHAFQIAFFRNLFGLVFTLPLFWRAGFGLLRTDRFRLYLLRCCTGLAAMLTGFWALVHLPLAQAVALSYTTPLFVTILAVLVLGEVVRARRWTAVAIGFLGVIVIVKPDVSGLQFAALVALASSALSASSAISIKYLSRTEPPNAIVIWMVLIMTPLSLVPALPVWQWPTHETWVWAVMTGGLGTAGHICLTRAFRLSDVSALQPLNFLQLPIVAFIAWMLFAEAIDIWTAVGAGIIFSSTIYIARREALLHRAKVTDPEIGSESMTNR